MVRFDVVVVGAGIAGCQLARDMARGGLKVAVVEAGPLRAAADVGWNDDLPISRADRCRLAREGQTIQARNILLQRHNRHFYVNDRHHPYMADHPFLWFRGRQVGGRSILWSRTCLRMSQRQFRPHPMSSAHWENWPFGLEELSPFYARVERDLGVSGQASGIEDLPDGAFVGMPASSPRIEACRERLCSSDGMLQVTSARLAALERSTLPASLREAISLGVQVFPDSPAVRLLISEGTRRAYGVEVESGAASRRRIEGCFVVLCASTIETVRILWQSRSVLHPDGIGNHADRLGRGIQDHLAINCSGPLAPDLSLLPHRGLHDPDDPWREERAHLLIWGRQPLAKRCWRPPAATPIDCLASLQMAAGRPFWSMLVLGASRADPVNRITLSQWQPGGSGVPRISLIRTADDRARLVALGRFASRVVRVGRLGRVGWTRSRRLLYGLAPDLAMALDRRPAGAAIHETGGARMGSDRNDSVVDPWGRCWDTDNVYVADGSVFPSAGFQNPTLTILALAARTAVHLLRVHAEQKALGVEEMP